MNRTIRCKGIEKLTIIVRDIESSLFMAMVVFENFHELEEQERNKATYKTIIKAYESNKY